MTIDAKRHRQAVAYVRWWADSVPGWFFGPDRHLFIDLLGDQVGGDLLEIGAYHGQSAILLGYLREPGERLIVCDPFDQCAGTDPERQRDASNYSSLSEQSFVRSYRRFHEALPVVLAEPSTVLSPAELGRGRFRAVHIDGSHCFPDVAHDLGLALDLLRPDGLMIVDDVRAWHSPGVAAAVWPFAREQLQVCCVTDKLYATADGPAACRYAEVAEACLLRRGYSVERHDLFGQRVPVLVPGNQEGDEGIARRWCPPAIRQWLHAARVAGLHAAHRPIERSRGPRFSRIRLRHSPG